MKRSTRRIFLLVLIAAALILSNCSNPFNSNLEETAKSRSAAVSLAEAGQAALINEFIFNHTGTDTHEFVEFIGEPNTDYPALTILEIEGDSTGAGIVDGVFPVGTTDASGYWTTGFLDNQLENGTASLLLVEGFSGSVGDDLDTDNDGILEATPWTVIVDDIAVDDGGSSDHTYASVVLLQGFDGVSYTVGGASRIPDGHDTDSVSDWVRNDYDGAGIPGFPGSFDTNEALNTPEAENELIPVLEVTIMEIQGTSDSSPLEGKLVRTRGVVTLETSDGRSFWMQDPAGDGDATTSDGIYVYHGGDAGDVSVGDLIEIVASVQEYTPASSPASQPLTELVSAGEIIVEAQGQPLPSPIPLEVLPHESIPDGVAFWEALEGMLVLVTHGRVVAATSQYGEFCVLANKNAKPGSGYQPVSKQILIREIGLNKIDYNPERILVDDGSLEEPVIVRPGDWVKRLVGVVDYTFGNYKLQPAEIDVQTQWPPRGPVSRRSGEHGNVTITTLNVENLFDLIDNPDKEDEGSTPFPDELEVKLTKLTLAIQEELGFPELLVVQEVENQEILQELGDRVNAAAGTSYTAVSFETSDVRGIEVGFLYKADSVTLLDAYQMSGPEVEDAFGPSSASPGREPLVGVFDFNGTEITVIGNHFKSKSGDDPLFGINWPPVRITEIQRKVQAQAVRNFVNGLLEADPKALVVVAGDLNDFQFGEPGESADHPLAILEGMAGDVPLSNVIHKVFEPLRFTYVYDGNSQVLDHILISPAVRRVFAGTDILHINASYPSILSEDPSTALRCSDHDAVELRLWLDRKGKRHHPRSGHK